MSKQTTVPTSWRHAAARRLEAASETLGEVLQAGDFVEAHAARARFVAGQLLGLGRALHTDAVAPWPVVTHRDIEHRLLVALRELRIVARWHGATTDEALATVGRVLDDLEELLRETRADGHTPLDRPTARLRDGTGGAAGGVAP